MANYTTTAVIPLKYDLLEQSREFGDIKTKLLGHWSTCLGLTLV